MASHVPSIGAAKAAGQGALPIALRALHGVGNDLKFAVKLDRHLPPPGDGKGVLAQIAGLLGTGTPMTAIVDGVAKALSDALARAAGNGGDPKARSTLQRSLAAALAPPGTSPPHAAVQMLEQRLTHLLTTLTSEPDTAGQQNEFSGNVLDAESAKEVPAQKKNSASGAAPQDEAASLAQSLLQAAVAGMSGRSAAAVSLQPKSAAPLHSANASAPQPQARPDILARILGRAANAQAQRATGIGVQVHMPVSGSANTATPSAVFERLIAIIAEHGGAQNDGSGTQSGGGDTQSNGGAQSNSGGNGHAAQGTSFTAQATPLYSTQPTSTVVAGAAGPAAPLHVPIDSQAVIEQLVKGIAMRSSGGTSQVRMRLQPEHLGDVSLKLTVTGTTISASVVAQSAHVRDLLLANQQQLARSLAQAGLSLGTFSVDVSGGNAGFTHQQSNDRNALERTNAPGLTLADDDEQWADPRFGPALLPAAKSLVLNYLV